MSTRLEEQAFELLGQQIDGFYGPDLAEKHQVLSWLGISRKFIRSFDALRLEVGQFKDISSPSDLSSRGQGDAETFA